MQAPWPRAGTGGGEERVLQLRLRRLGPIEHGESTDSNCSPRFELDRERFEVALSFRAGTFFGRFWIGCIRKEKCRPPQICKNKTRGDPNFWVTLPVEGELV